jgi:hypothetical protein
LADEYQPCLADDFRRRFAHVFGHRFTVRDHGVSVRQVLVLWDLDPVFEGFCEILCAMPFWLKQVLLNDVLGRFFSDAILDGHLAISFTSLFGLVFTSFGGFPRARICLYTSVQSAGRDLCFSHSSAHLQLTLGQQLPTRPPTGSDQPVYQRSTSIPAITYTSIPAIHLPGHPLTSHPSISDTYLSPAITKN